MSLTASAVSHVTISGGTSFTAAWIARSFAEHGFRVSVLCPGRVEDYKDLKKLRLTQISKIKDSVTIHSSVRSDDGSMDAWILEHRPEIWVHHHHWMKDFRSPQYDIEIARAIGLRPLPGILKSLKAVGCRGILFSGSYSEPTEAGRNNLAPLTSYSKSKLEVWDELSKLALSFDLKLSKVVVPNPIGPMENEDRLIPAIVASAAQGKPFKVMNGESISDNLPVLNLANAYVKSARELLEGKSGFSRPSGWVCTTNEMISAINRELLEKRLDRKPCEILYANPPGAKIELRNPQSESIPVDMKRFWDSYAEFMKSGEIF